MPLRLPTKVGIGHHTFRIEELSPAEADKERMAGDCNYVLSRIRVRLDKCSGPEASNTLLHEILHGCWFVAGLSARPSEERAVTRLSNVLTQVLRDNPDVAAYIVERARE